MTLKPREKIEGNAGQKHVKAHHVKRSRYGARLKTNLKMAGVSYTEDFLQGLKLRQAKKL
jgi:hypothetical protein